MWRGLGILGMHANHRRLLGHFMREYNGLSLVPCPLASATFSIGVGPTTIQGICKVARGGMKWVDARLKWVDARSIATLVTLYPPRTLY